MLYEMEDLINAIPVFEMKEIQTTDGKEIRTRKAIFSDKGEFIEIVSNRYNLLQPRELLKKLVESKAIELRKVVIDKGKFIYIGKKEIDGKEYKVRIRNSVDRSNSFMILVYTENKVPLVFSKTLHTKKDIEEVAKGLVGLIERMIKEAERRRSILENLAGENKKEVINFLRDRLFEKYFSKIKDKERKRRIEEEIWDEKLDDVAKLYRYVLDRLTERRRKEFLKEKVAMTLAEYIVKMLEVADVFVKI